MILSCLLKTKRAADSWHKSWLVVVKGFTPTLRLKLLYVFDAPMRAMLRHTLLAARYFWEVESKKKSKSWKFWKSDSTSDSASWTRDSAISRRIYEQHNVRALRVQASTEAGADTARGRPTSSRRFRPSGCCSGARRTAGSRCAPSWAGPCRRSRCLT